jgi:translation initiation factor 1 (eIF-1/SUI1)
MIGRGKRSNNMIIIIIIQERREREEVTVVGGVFTDCPFWRRPLVLIFS